MTPWAWSIPAVLAVGLLLLRCDAKAQQVDGKYFPWFIALTVANLVLASRVQDPLPAVLGIVCWTVVLGLLLTRALRQRRADPADRADGPGR